MCSGPHGTGSAGSTIQKGTTITHMAITRSLRSFAAAALAAGLVLPAAASAANRPAVAGGNVSHASPPRAYQRHKVDGVLQTSSGTAAPATLIVQTGSTTTTVTVAATTKVVRRYNGLSSLDELTAGDRITAWGSFDKGSPTTFDAQRLKDWSIQRAYTRVVGSVATVQNGLVTLHVARGRSVHSPYWHGEDVWVTLPPSAIVTSGSVTVTVDAVQPGVRVLVLGLYDRTSHTLRAYRVRILPGPRRHDPVAAATPEAGVTTTPTP
jgi:hypothetical protein